MVKRTGDGSLSPGMQNMTEKTIDLALGQREPQ